MARYNRGTMPFVTLTEAEHNARRVIDFTNKISNWLCRANDHVDHLGWEWWRALFLWESCDGYPQTESEKPRYHAIRFLGYNGSVRFSKRIASARWLLENEALVLLLTPNPAFDQMADFLNLLRQIYRAWQGEIDIGTVVPSEWMKVRTFEWKNDNDMLNTYIMDTSTSFKFKYSNNSN
jgi:hypothetical protein